MRFVTRTMPPPFDAFVRKLWYCEAPDLPLFYERIMPNATPSVLINLLEDEQRWYDAPDGLGAHRGPGAMVEGAFAEHFSIDTREQQLIAGVDLHPGGLWPFLRVPADELGGQHVALEDLWGPGARSLRERLLEQPSAELCLETLERALIERVVRAPERDPAIDFALEKFSAHEDAWTIGDVTAHLGLSARCFIQKFSARVGLTPKKYARVQRFQRVLTVLENAATVSWTDVAHASGYYDQAHFTHDFRAFAGMTPSEYFQKRRYRNHVPG